MSGSNAVSVFQFHSHEIRTVIKDGEPWFVATDIAEALGYRNAPDAARHLDHDEKGTQIVRTLGGAQKLTIINESGLYALVLRSRKPEARKFAKWVTGEVLPAIRKTGKYIVNDPDTVTVSRNQLYILCWHTRHISQAWMKTLEPSLRVMGSPIAGNLRDHVVSAHLAASTLSDFMAADKAQIALQLA